MKVCRIARVDKSNELSILPNLGSKGKEQLPESEKGSEWRSLRNGVDRAEGSGLGFGEGWEPIAQAHLPHLLTSYISPPEPDGEEFASILARSAGWKSVDNVGKGRTKNI